MSGPGPEQRGSFFDALRRRATPAEANGVMVPRGLRVATAYAWRLLVIAAGVGVAIWLVIQLKLLIIPLLIAILVSALLWPAFSWMLRHRWPRWLAIVVSVIGRSEEHTSELQSLMRISYAVFCLKKKTKTKMHSIPK